jgi:formiminoglutamate deiminase
MYRAAALLDPDSYRELATAVYAEMACAGITTVGEFHYLHHGPDGRPYRNDAMGEAIVDAAASAGVRLTLIDTCYLAGGIGQELNGEQLRFGDRSVETWASRVEELSESETVKVAAAVHSVRAVPPSAIAEVAEWARQRGTPLHAHLSEQIAENAECLSAYDRTPTEVLSDAGALDGFFTAVHATHLTDSDLARLGEARCRVCLCPTTERDLGDGIGPAAALRSAGCRLCLGSDSNAVIDLFEEARAAELDERLETGTRGLHSPATLLADATSGGADALGWFGGGRLAVGAPADWCTVSMTTPRMAGTLGPAGQGAVASLVFACGAADVTNVVVAGRRIVAEREHVMLGPVGPLLVTALRRMWDS